MTSSSVQSHITKRVYLNSLSCRTLGWFNLREAPGGKLSAGEALRMAEGQRVGEAARRCYGPGHLVAARSIEAAVQQTRQLLNDPKTSVLFEAAFCAGKYATRADIVARRPDGWHLTEVKASLDKSDHLYDLAYTAHVMAKAGTPPARTFLQLLDRGYRLGQPEPQLFATPLDLTADVQDFLESKAEFLARLETDLFAPAPIAPQWCPTCRGCAHFATQCVGAGIKHPVVHLPRLSKTALAKLCSCGAFDISAIPEDFKLTPRQAVVHRAVLQNRPQVSAPSLRAVLDGIEWPAAYLDFETVQTALPRFPGVAPYEQVVTQFSLHLCVEPTAEARHFEYLSSSDRDCRRELLEHLLECVAEAKTIIVYSPFEKTILKGLARRFRDRAGEVEACLQRLVDLNRAFSPTCYYHPDFNGSASVKTVLPVLEPELTYDDLDINNGDQAVAMFVKLIDGECVPTEASVIRKQLLAYCQRDSWAMVALHKRLQELIAPSRSAGRPAARTQ